MSYLVIFERSATGYGAYAPDLPGCAVVGKTLDEVRELMREAIALHLEMLAESGEAIPEPSTTAQMLDPLPASAG